MQLDWQICVHHRFVCTLQISAARLGEDQKLKLPRFLEEEEKDPEATKQVRAREVPRRGGRGVGSLMTSMLAARGPSHGVSRWALERLAMCIRWQIICRHKPRIHEPSPKCCCHTLHEACLARNAKGDRVSLRCRLQDLADKIAQLNSAIDDVSSQLRAQDVAQNSASAETTTAQAA